MAQLRILPPAAKFLKKLKDKRLKTLYREAIDRILEDHTVGEAKTGDLAGVFGYDIYYKNQLRACLYRRVCERQDCGGHHGRNQRELLR